MVTSNKKTLFIRLLALLLVAVFSVSALVSCSKDGSGDENEENGEKVTYTVSLKSAGGMALSEIDVFIYKDADLKEMIEFAKTNEEGKVEFKLASNGKYHISVDAPKGYEVKKSYQFDGTSLNLTLKSSVIKGEELSSVTLGVGDVMRDFTVMTYDGKEITLSDVLKDKKMVMLNFWYTTCSWCVTEFPIMDEVYQDYKDDIEIIAVNNYPLDNVDSIASFQSQMNLSFPVAIAPAAWSNTFGIQGYPTSVFIDRYGVICLIESGAITSKRPFMSAFDHFTADDYKQKLCVNGVSDLVSQVLPTYTMDTSENIAAVLNKGEFEVTYRPETEDENAEYIWPFIVGEKLGEECIYASNKGIDSSYAIIYADVTLKAGQAVGFDYISSTERFSDIMYVIVNDEDIFQISGVSEDEKWQSCYPCVAETDGVYEIALCFLKDSDTGEGDDTVYIKDMRVIDADDIDVETYLPREAATTTDGFEYDYVEIVYNDRDGYYHVGSKNGPLLLADLMGYTQFSQDETVQDIVADGRADKGGVSLYDKEGGNMVKYFSYASNSALQGVCTVNKELSEMLLQVAEVAGFENNDKEWLKICKYYQVYGPKSQQLEDPIKGLAPFSAYETKLGKNVSTNEFTYDRAIIPRGLLSEFVPSKSGVYRFTSKSDYADGIDAWLFNSDGEVIYTYEHDERMYTDSNNCSIVYYMEAGKPYYVNMAFWDVYATGTIKYDVEYLGSSLQFFRAAAPGYFTYDSDAQGEAIYDIITGGITPVLKNGKYYDSEDGSLIYADFTGLTNIFGNSISEMINMGGFDFSKSETDGEILAYLRQNDNDVAKTDEYLKKLWGDDYDVNAENYQIDDIFEGRYHGDGEDMTEQIRKYVNKIDKSGNKERNGCVEVDEELAELLQMLMDKYTFEGVDDSWLKLCYYYDYLGPND